MREREIASLLGDPGVPRFHRRGSDAPQRGKSPVAPDLGYAGPRSATGSHRPHGLRIAAAKSAPTVRARPRTDAAR